MDDLSHKIYEFLHFTRMIGRPDFPDHKEKICKDIEEIINIFLQKIKEK
jgi:hypothetical protein